MSPEERAAVVRESVMEAIFHDGSELQEIDALIAQAIRDAENEALERAGLIARRQALEEAAQVCDGHFAEWREHSRCSPKVLSHAAHEIRVLKGFDYSDIRSLKSQEI